MAQATFGTTATWAVWTWAIVWLLWSLAVLYVALRVSGSRALAQIMPAARARELRAEVRFAHSAVARPALRLRSRRAAARRILARRPRWSRGPR